MRVRMLPSLLAAIAAALLSTACGAWTGDDVEGGELADAEPPPPDLGPPDAAPLFDEPPHPPPEFARTPPELTYAEATPPPLSGGSMAISVDGRWAVVGDPDRAEVHVADVQSGRARSLPAAGEPGRVVIEPGGARAYVALRRAGAVLVVDIEAAERVAEWAVCPSPRGLAIEGDALHVACAGGWLLTLDRETGAERRRVAVAPDLRDVVVESGRLHVSRFRAAELWTLDADGAVARVQRAEIPRRRPAVAWRTIARPGGGVLMLHQSVSDARVDTRRRGGYGGFIECDGLVVDEVTAFDGAGERAPSTLGLVGTVLAVDLAADPTGMAVAAPGSASPGTMPEFTSIFVGRAPTPGAEVGSRTCANTEGLDRRDLERDFVTAVALRPDGTPLAFRRTPAALVEADGTVRARLSGVSVEDTGYELFHTNAGAGIACASCHPEGSDDGVVWHFDDVGPRRTQELRGGLAGTAPFHWAGELADLRSLVDEVMSRRMGGPALEDGHVDALMGWLDAQPVEQTDPPPSGAGDPARGAAVFAGSAGCAACHSGPRLSDGLMHDIGRGEAIETPTLLGIGRRAPLMHDGCAANLSARFDPSCGGEAHGAVAGLDAQALDDLIAYLETL